MPFKYIHIELCEDELGIELLAEFEKLRKRDLRTKFGNHSGSMVCQIFTDVSNPRRFFLSGRLMTVAETDALAKIIIPKRKKR